MAWENPLVTGAVIASTLLFATLVTFGSYSILTLTAYLILLQIIVCATYVNGLRMWQAFQGQPASNEILYPGRTIFITEDRVREAVIAITNGINWSVVQLLDALRCTDNWHTFQLACACIGAAIIGKLVSGVWLVALVIVGACTIPKIYEQKKAEIDNKIAMLSHKLSNIVARVPLLKRPKAD